MAIASVQQVVETTDSFDDGSMVATLPGAVTVGNAVVVITLPEQSGRSVTGISGAAASFTLLESMNTTPPNATLIGHAAIATATTAAQTVTLDDTTEFGGDVVIVQELSGCASPLDESGTSLTIHNTSNTTDHNLGTITPDGTDTAYFAAVAFDDDHDGLSNGTGTNLADWTEYTTGLPNTKAWRRIVNGSSAGVTFRITSATARMSNGIFFALNGAAAGGSAIAAIARHYRTMKQ